MDDGTPQREFTFRRKTYRVLHRDGQWLVIDGELETTGRSLVDAMEAVFGPLYDHELTRIAVHLLNFALALGQSEQG